MFLFTAYNDGNFKAWKRFKKIEDNINEDVRNLFRLKKEIKQSDYKT